MATQFVLIGTVLQGTRSPLALVIDLVPSTGVPDLSVVLTADLEVIRDDGRGVTQIWTCSMTNQTATTLRLVHPWVHGDNDTPGETLHVYGRLTTPAGVVLTIGMRVIVLKK